MWEAPAPGGIAKGVPRPRAPFYPLWCHLHHAVVGHEVCKGVCKGRATPQLGGLQSCLTCPGATLAFSQPLCSSWGFCGLVSALFFFRWCDSQSHPPKITTHTPSSWGALCWRSPGASRDSASSKHRQNALTQSTPHLGVCLGFVQGCQHVGNQFCYRPADAWQLVKLQSLFRIFVFELLECFLRPTAGRRKW